jgi:hypothetical protein
MHLALLLQQPRVSEQLVTTRNTLCVTPFVLLLGHQLHAGSAMSSHSMQSHIADTDMLRARVEQCMHAGCVRTAGCNAVSSQAQVMVEHISMIESLLWPCLLEHCLPACSKWYLCVCCCCCCCVCCCRSLDFLVALQAFLTVVGNCTCWLAAYRIYSAAQAEKSSA